jgi:hypothetical protein
MENDLLCLVSHFGTFDHVIIGNIIQYLASNVN